MRTKAREPRIGWRFALGALTLMLLVAIGTALASTPSTTAYRFSSHPMISGTVVSVNDHHIVVQTDQGEQVPLEVDTRTMAPRDLAPGMVMRAEFLALEDCRFYAQRITALRSGMSNRRDQAYANTQDAGGAVERNASRLGLERHDYVTVESGESLRSSEEVPARNPIMTASPTTADYQSSTRPLISGTVLSVNDHRMTVATDQGRRVGLVMDSRTMVPGEVAPGTEVRAEFTRLKDGRYYAKRITRTGRGDADREQAYANTRDAEVLLALGPADCDFAGAATENTVTAIERRGSADTVYVVQRVSDAAEVPETLPQTASHQPLLLLLGMLGLGSAGLLTVARALRVV